MLDVCKHSGSEGPFSRHADWREAIVFFYAKLARPVYIEIPIEDFEPGDEGNVATLNLSLYGTRDAAQNWAREYTRFLRECGFVAGLASPCNGRHSLR